MNEVKNKLKVDEYVLEINGIDINQVYLTYSFDTIDSFFDKNGEKLIIDSNEFLNIELEGEDECKNSAFISFLIKTNLAWLNKLPSIPTDITNLLHESESFMLIPGEENSTFLNFNKSQGIEDDMYKKCSSLFAYKIDNNKFIFKLTTDEVFTYFKLEVV